jgi:hypothetical protein
MARRKISGLDGSEKRCINKLVGKFGQQFKSSASSLIPCSYFTILARAFNPQFFSMSGQYALVLLVNIHLIVRCFQ